MHVLVTGSEGRIGRYQVEALRSAGYETTTLDRRGSSRAVRHLIGDLRDVYTVRRAVQGVDAVVHLGALANDGQNTPEDVYAINVMGTLNVLQACVEAGIGRVVYYSSVQALGNFRGFRKASYLPIDDAYPPHPMSPYQLSKHLGEAACRSYTDRHGLVTIALRPVFVADPHQYHRFGAYQADRDLHGMRSDYWSYVDVRDVVEAARLALENSTIENGAFLLAAADTLTDTPTAELVDTFYPDTPWRVDRDAYLAAVPNRSLLDCSGANGALGWRPAHSWRTERGEKP